MMKLPFYRRYHLHPKPFNFIISERVAILKSSPQRRQFDLRPVTLDTTSVENAVAWLQPHRNQTTTKHPSARLRDVAATPHIAAKSRPALP
jgi:hypothetical protein